MDVAICSAGVQRTIEGEVREMESTDTPPDRDAAAAQGRPRVDALPSDDMLGDLAHAVANSLNTVVTASQLAGLQMGDGRMDKARESLACVERECLRVARLLQDGRAFAGYRIAATATDVDLADLLAQCAATFSGRGNVQVDAEPGVAHVRGDPEALRRLLVELFDNAFEFGAQRVDVMLAMDESGRSVCLDLQDDGPGIGAAPARVFAPFFSTRPEEHSGLGLALAARIAARHGGSIAVESSGRGARLRVTLPRADG